MQQSMTGIDWTLVGGVDQFHSSDIYKAEN